MSLGLPSIRHDPLARILMLSFRELRCFVPLARCGRRWLASLALGLMLVTRTVHPPAGANPILMIHAHAGWFALFQPVLLSISVLAIVAAIWSRLYPGLCAYPVDAKAPSPIHIHWGGWPD